MPDYGHDLRFGVFITPSHADADAVVALAVLADDIGLDLVTFQDHPYQSRYLDTWTLLSFVAARTTRVHLAANVLNLRLRDPSVLAGAVASLDILSDGRTELGIGAGAFGQAAERMGARPMTAGQSVDALEEAIDVIRALWDVEAKGYAIHDGRYYRLDRAPRGPAPVHPVGVWIGAYKPRMLGLVGRKGDGWLPSLPYLAPGALAAGNAAIDAAAGGVGRKPAEIRRMLNIPAQSSTVGELEAYALDGGISTFILMADDSDAIRRFGSEVAPAVRERIAAARGARPPI